MITPFASARRIVFKRPRPCCCPPVPVPSPAPPRLVLCSLDGIISSTPSQLPRDRYHSSNSKTRDSAPISPPRPKKVCTSCCALCRTNNETPSRDNEITSRKLRINRIRTSLPPIPSKSGIRPRIPFLYILYFDWLIIFGANS